MNDDDDVNNNNDDIAGMGGSRRSYLARAPSSSWAIDFDSLQRRSNVRY